MAKRKLVTEQAEGLPAFVPFQIAKLVAAPPQGYRWLHEIKFDGYRIQVRVENHAFAPATGWTGPNGSGRSRSPPAACSMANSAR